jgi:hypothetical protein
MQSSIRSLGYIQFKTYCVHVSHDLDRDQYVCFKSTQSHCDIDTFDNVQAAVDYILIPMSSLVYYVSISGETDQ